MAKERRMNSMTITKAAEYVTRKTGKKISPGALRYHARQGTLDAELAGSVWITWPDALDRWITDPLVHRRPPKRRSNP